MSQKAITRLDLVEGGTEIRQGHHFKLSFSPRDAGGNVVDLTGKKLDVVIVAKQGIVYETTAAYNATEKTVEFSVNENIGHGDMWIEITATDPNNASYRQKFPTAEHEGRLRFVRGTDDIAFVGFSGKTIAEFKAEQTSFQLEIDEKFERAAAALTEDSEVALARDGEVSLNVKLTKDKQAFTAQLAETAKKSEVLVERTRIDNLAKLTQGSTTGDAELIDGRVGKDGITYSNIGAAIRGQVGNVSAIVEQKVLQLKSKSGKNLYNPAINQIGQLEPWPIGRTQTLSGTSLVSQRVKLDNTKSVTFKGFRMYAITDKNNIVLKQMAFVNMIDTTTIAVANIPAGECYLWVSTYPANVSTDAQIEYGDTLSTYELYKETEAIYVNDNKVLDYPVVIDGGATDNTGSNDDEFSYQIELAKLENDLLKEQVDVLKTNSLAIFNAKMDKVSEKVGVTLRSPAKQKLILHLHKRANNGYDTKNDVYLPNAENDFSDIKITSDTGDVLPYRVIYKGQGDIISDSRLGKNHNGKVLNDSQKRMFVSYNGYLSISENNGVTWTKIPAFSTLVNAIATLISADDTLFFSLNGKLYRSPAPYTSYTQVLDLSVGFTSSVILSTSMVQHPDGELFVSSYQTEYSVKVFKSTDNGLTWVNVLDNSKYQHIHNLFIDKHATPIAIYAGCDAGGGVYKTTDKGATWVDLKATYTMPQSTDYGVIYSDPSGYRLLGGETAIQGGYSIIKTTDDVNFNSSLGVGNSVYFANKLGGKLYAIGNGTNGFQSATVYVSENDGASWKQVYTTSPLNDSAGASDGFRFMAKNTYMGAPAEQLIVGCQSPTRSPLRIMPDGYYAEIIVDVPFGCTQIFVEDGYAYTNINPIANDTKAVGDFLINFDLNENGSVVKEHVSGKYYSDVFEWTNTGKHLASFYPYIIAPNERASVLTKSLKGFEINGIDTSLGITISLWGRLSYDTNIELIRTASNMFMSLNRHAITIDGVTKGALNFPVTLDSMNKLDLIIKADGTSTSYVNGHLVYTAINNFSDLLASIKASNIVKVLKTQTSHPTDCIQHFSIRKGVVGKAQLYDEYNSLIVDNMGD